MLIAFALAAALPIAPQQAVATPQAAAEPMPDQAETATPTLPKEDTAEEIAKDSARDLKDSRFYNQPGATRADYDKAWQECRLIARGSRTPSGMVPVYYNPAYISPLAAGIGAGIGGAIGAAIADGQLRRANRRSCLLIRGWRLVEVSDAEQARIAKLTDADRDAYFNAIVGATDVKGALVTSWHNDYAAPAIAPESEQ